ncbi:MAG: heterodisulfide reductase-related iron-sulfur binding cluster [Myxococcales bacterium]|nr:heterodisulfide reductase-related iron-sulfur binding cluster [Myxococcales bacterium]
MRPERDPCFDPNDARYYDADDLHRELQRVFSICHGCRMCVGYCPSFPELFKRVDAYEEGGHGEIEAFVALDYEAVNQQCFQCKLCYIKCPYTPDDGHEFKLDFPRLMLRHKAQLARRDGVSLQDRVLGEPQRLGAMGSGAMAPLMNFVSKNRLLRKVQQAATGISADFNLPPFASTTLRSYFERHTPADGAGEKGEVALFSTCTTNFNMPSTGIAAIQVLEHNGFKVHFPEGQTCCGMPNLDGGDVEAAKAKARANVEVLLPLVERGVPILVPGPTCGYVLKKDYADLLGSSEAAEVAAHSFDLMEFLRLRLRDKTLRRDFEKPLGRIAYHSACHLRAQKIGAPGRILLSKVPETEVEMVEECSAVDGTWGMKAQHYAAGRHYARKLVQGLREEPFDAVATDCPLSGQRIAAELHTEAYHPIELLNRAYGLPEVSAASAAVAED